MEDIKALVDWSTDHGATLHPSVEVYDDPTTGFSFRVKPSSENPLPAWDQVVSLPTRLSLSYLDVIHAASSNPIFPAEFVSQTPPHVIGRFFLAKQYLLGRDSFWWPYIQALPQPADEDSWCLPPFWPTDDAELLEGTNVEVGLEKIRADVRKEHAAAAALLKQHGDEKDKEISMKLYQWAYCIFSSRSFKPSLVLAEEEQTRLPDGIGINDFSVLLPLFDIGNHDMTLDVRWELQQKPHNTCELRVGRSFQPGQQVFNNYSMKTNAELLLGYGFMIPPTEELHNDYTHVRKRTSSPSASEEYYISRRPMAHSSSLLGRYRQELTVELPEGKSIIGTFQHVQPDMVWDIFCTLCQPEERAQIMPSDAATLEEQEVARQRQFFSGDVKQGSQAHAYLEHTMGIIQHKVMQELERLEETEVELVDGQEGDLTRNQRLALEYRRRCRAVLENTLEAMGLEEEAA
ncbi:SET domain protein [Emericellopsis atlantica]|uniref:SET domain protein n=1 Tax=Emericellopsis atlantica TaxID=2614577 RepID=A0A9P7ZRQ6_9HYPO|nr:SET domain protein [Emericellopsis atlantica]KAG9256627.1 SET domain protein [Emericellopsis atlantica]